MKCADLQNTLALYADDETSAEGTAMLGSHLTSCPLCRQKKDDFARIRHELRNMGSPSLPARAQDDLKIVLRAEIRRAVPQRVVISRDFAEWLKMSVMPYGVGVAASLLVGIGLLTIMFSGQFRRTNESLIAKARTSSVRLAPSRSIGEQNASFTLTPGEIVNSRMGFAQDSPSINPQGALIALTKSLVRGEMKDEEVVVVADVFSNGLAKISEVVESPRDGRVVDELGRALNGDSNYAPFVPTVIENRPESMQIILKITTVNVPTGTRPVRRRS